MAAGRSWPATWLIACGLWSRSIRAHSPNTHIFRSWSLQTTRIARYNDRNIFPEKRLSSLDIRKWYEAYTQGSSRCLWAIGRWSGWWWARCCWGSADSQVCWGAEEGCNRVRQWPPADTWSSTRSSLLHVSNAPKRSLQTRAPPAGTGTKIDLFITFSLLPVCFDGVVKSQKLAF